MNHSYPHLAANKIPGYSWVGLIIMVAAQYALWEKVSWVSTWLTPIMWSGYILLIDGLVHYRRGTSWLTTRKREFPLLLLLSIGIWLVFEAYNLHLQNWLYGGVPASPWLRNLAYAWSFATILPGVFVTSELIYSFLPTNSIKIRKITIPDGSWFLAGAALVLVPLAAPQQIARYLFGAVWVGFILLVDPINARSGAPSIKQRWTQGDRGIVVSLLLGGLLCGLFWEAWNYQAYLNSGGHWIYTVPEALRIFGLHYGQMPVLGMLGFPPFAIELYVMYHFLRSALGIERLLGRLDW